MKELHKIVGENIVLAIVGNKIDLRNRVVELDKAKEYAASVGAVHYETSAKNNTGVTEMFSDVTKSLYFGEFHSGLTPKGLSKLTRNRKTIALEGELPRRRALCWTIPPLLKRPRQNSRPVVEEVPELL